MRAFSNEARRALTYNSSRIVLGRSSTILPSRALINSASRTQCAPLNMRRFYSEDATAKKEKEEGGKKTDSDLTEDQKRITELETKLDEKTKEAVELRNRLLRSVADFRNLQQVTKKDIQAAKDFALQKFAKDLLESVDNFGHALNAFKEDDIKKNQEINDLYTGVRMTRDVFEKTLVKHGIQKLDPVGEEFDPNMHEATFELPQPDKQPGTVFHVQQVGFTLNNRVLRPAKVGIVKDAEDAKK